jgi:hypothetical protein
MPIFFPTTITGKPAASGGPKVVTFQTSDSSSAGTSSTTFTAKAIGTAASDRYVIVAVCVLNNASATPSTVTVGGNSATRQVRSARGGGIVDIWTVLVTTGTTADVVVTCAAAPNRVGIIIWSATGLSSGTAVGTGTENTATSPHTTGSFSTSNGGFVVAASCDNGAPTYTESVTGGGSPTVTEDVDAVFGGSPTMMGMHTGSTNGTSITVTVTGGTNANGGVAAASF